MSRCAPLATGSGTVARMAPPVPRTRGGDRMKLPALRRGLAALLSAGLLVGMAGTSVQASARASHRAGITFGPLQDISIRAGNEAETAVAIQNTNTNHVTVVSNIGSG